LSKTIAPLASMLVKVLANTYNSYIIVDVNKYTMYFSKAINIFKINY
jgi:hypothetical protein